MRNALKLISVALLLSVMGCKTVVIRPYPCVPLAETDAPAREYLELEGAYGALRGWIRHSDQICRANMELLK